MSIRDASVTPSKTAVLLDTAAWIVWTIMLVALAARPLLLLQRGTSFDTYNLAGTHWLRGETVYTQWMGFVYSPLVAAFFAPLALLPLPLANILWRMVNAATLLAGTHAILKTGLFSGIRKEWHGLAYLLLAPLAAGNIDISQANPFVAGLIMLAIAAVRGERWNWAAFWIAVATYFKIYPLAVGLLVCVVAPRRFAWRLVVMLLLLGAAPFLMQNWSYVSRQYGEWIATRMAENRRNWPVEKLPLDLWFVVHWVLRLPVSQQLFSVLQPGSGVLIAGFCAFGLKNRWSSVRLLTGIFLLSAIWMTLCGPATESYTYLLLAPASVLAMVASLFSEQPFRLRLLVWCSLLLQYLAIARSSFAPHFKPFWILAALPLSALLFLGYCLPWLLNDTFWKDQS